MPIREDLDAFKNVFNEEAGVFIEKLRNAAADGAQSISEQLKESAVELLPESAVIADKLRTAFQSGATIAGEQIAAAGARFAEALRAARPK
ncbi:hypothetical protein [Cohnella sp. GCM10027633]|uniref:hypothetical protein n=1 Tax=unclassified Cohnella TaxID=2636738 RepID=UPI0036345553